MCIKRYHRESEKKTDILGENICKHISDKEFILRIYKEFLQLSDKKTLPGLKMSKGSDQTLLQRRNTNGQ